MVTPNDRTGIVRKDGIVFCYMKDCGIYQEGWKGNKSFVRALRTLFCISSFIYVIVNLLFAFRIYLFVNRLRRKSKVEMIITHEGQAPAFFLVLLGRNNVITELHTPYYLIDSKTKNFGKKNYLRYMISPFEEIQTRKSAGIVAPSQILASIVSRDWGISSGSIRIIPNGVNLERLEVLSKMDNKSTLFKKYVLFPARLEKLKGLLILVDAMDEIFKRNPDINLVIVGRLSADIYDGAWADFYARNEERICIIEHMPQEQLIPIMRDSFCVLVPSLWESFSMTCVESMALGKIVIGTRMTGMEEIIEDGMNGFLVDPNNAVMLADAIQHVLMQSGRERMYIEENARKSAGRYDMRKMADRLIDYAKSVVI